MACKRITLIFLLLSIFSGCGITGYGSFRYVEKKRFFYTVARGETLWGIGQKFGVEPEEIQSLNGIRDPKSLRAGQQLLLVARVESDPDYDKMSGGKGERASLTTSSSRGPKEQVIIPKEGGVIGWPIKQGRIVSRFGPRNGDFHDGIDFAAPIGTPIYAAHSGRVAYSGDRLSGYGNLILLRASSGLTTVYAHNRRLLVREGEAVSRGQKIAELGETGRASGPHLHFELRLKDKKDRYVAVDPMPHLNGTKTPARYRVNESLTPIINGSKGRK